MVMTADSRLPETQLLPSGTSPPAKYDLANQHNLESVPLDGVRNWFAPI